MVKQVSFSFVILHYVALEETLKCVESIRKFCSSYDYNIIIVDNLSPNDTGIELKRKYKSSQDVTVILNDKNDGYARGNNVGITYSRANFSSDFLVVLNNDIKISDDKFCSLIVEEYARSRFAILGPKINLPSGLTDTYPFEPTTKSRLISEMIVNSVKIIALRIHVYDLLLRARKVAKHNSNDEQHSGKLSRKEDVVLHGSCLVFSGDFFEKLDGFDPRTFMYKEEQLLYLKVQRYSLKTVYSNLINVEHNAGASTGVVAGSSRGKLLFLYRNQLKSSAILLREMIGLN